MPGGPCLIATPRPWTLVLLVASASLAAGLGGIASAALALSWLAVGLFAAALAGSALTFGLLARRVRHLERAQEGLVEELSQELDRFKDKLDAFSAALAKPRTIAPEEREAAEQAATRRVTVK
ncbi:MAG TPA: hypothetical protein VHH36_06845 [Candidatus Thermoplasmatota archaeon]|nr:hypothetical protein [Candidatus Thermoplasmatota archaeon]